MVFSDFEAEIKPSDDRKTPTYQQSILGTSCGTFLDYCLRWRPVCFHDFANNEANTKGTVLAAYCSLTHNNKAKTARRRPLYFGKHSRRLLAIHDDKARPPTAGRRTSEIPAADCRLSHHKKGWPPTAGCHTYKASHAANCSLSHTNKSQAASCRPSYLGKHGRRLQAVTRQQCQAADCRPYTTTKPGL